MLSRISQWNLNRVRLSTMLCTFLAVSTLLGPSPSSAQKQDEKSHEERIKNLEAELEKLTAEKEKKTEDPDQAFTAAAAEEVKEVKGMTPEQLEKWKKGVASGHNANYDAAWHIGTPARDVVDKGWWGIANSPSEFRISGWVQVAERRKNKRPVRVASPAT
ncbi:MAG: hypothetical protein WBM74_05975 [Polyangiales bacterium]